MKVFRFITSCLFALLAWQCKTVQPTAPSATPSLLEAHSILDSTQQKFLAFADSTNGDPWIAIMRTAEWLDTQSTVESAVPIDSTTIKIVLKSGLSTIFSFDDIGADGLSVFRGGGSGGSSARLVPFGTASQHTIANKRVLIFAATAAEFYAPGELQKVVDVLTNSGLGLDVTLMTNAQCTHQVVETFKDYGLVIIDSHGLPDAFMIGTEIVLTEPPTSEADLFAIIDAELGAGAHALLESGDLILWGRLRINSLSSGWQRNTFATRSKDLCLTSTYLDRLPAMSGTVIMGNMCFSGWNVPGSLGRIAIPNPIATAFSHRNVISYYGYAVADGRSLQVSNSFAKRMEDSLVHALVVDTDSTGIAHLQSDNTEFVDPHSSRHPLFFKHFGADDYSYATCGDPITDDRDGQTYKTVCIGTQQWMAQNLNFNTAGSVYYDNDAANGGRYGRLYDWTSFMQGAAASTAAPSGVRGVCPKGWHVPSKSEFDTLVTLLGGGHDINEGAGKALKDTVLWTQDAEPLHRGTNSSGFSGLPGGYGTLVQGNPGFINLNKEAGFWTTTEVSPTLVFYLGLHSYNNNSEMFDAVKTSQLSCRCVKDK